MIRSWPGILLYHVGVAAIAFLAFAVYPKDAVLTGISVGFLLAAGFVKIMRLVLQNRAEKP